jgi:hypothetical protein
MALRGCLTIAITTVAWIVIGSLIGLGIGALIQTTLDLAIGDRHVGPTDMRRGDDVLLAPVVPAVRA